MKISKVLGANGQAACDCGKLEFHVLVRVMPDGNNHIVVLRCVDCKHELAVPFNHGGPQRSLDDYPTPEAAE